MPETPPLSSSPPKPARRGRGWRWLLVGSLALNRMFIGVFAGAAWRFGPPGPHGPGGPMGRGARGPGSELSVLWRALPHDEIEAMRRDAPQGPGPREGRPPREGGESEAERRAGREAREAEFRLRLGEIARLLGAEPFDPAPLSALLGERLDRQAERSAEMLAHMLERISGLTAQERATMAARINERHPE